MNQREQITQFLLEHPLINISGLEKLAGIPIRTIRLAHRPIPDQFIPQIAVILKDYGYKEKKALQN